ncbi:MAG: glycerate kinase [Chthoniobacterales bacterium]
MRILIAPDKFKGSLDARAVAENIAIGLRDVLPDAVIATVPVADGGEGTAAVIGESCGGERITCLAHDALGREITADYFWLGDRRTAVMEMSATAGLWRIAAHECDLLRANTFGVGEMTRDAAQRNPKEILIGLGGSATNDGGFGMARALGYRFLKGDRELQDISELARLDRIVVPDRPLPAKIVAAVDVRNPLLGPRGATRTFGRQKGATAEQSETLESVLERLAEVVKRDLGFDFRDQAGAGAAGGLGFGLMSFCGATIKPGFDVVAEFVGLRAAIGKADIVITGEGRLDGQTLEGKGPAGVARLARESGKRVFAIAGAASDSPQVHGLFDDVLTLVTPPVTPEEAIARAGELLQERARELARMM